MVISGYLVLKWMHILALVYWLGGEWGVFQTAYSILNPHLSLEERRHHLETAYRIDILARLGILLLLPLGFQMGAIIGVNPFGAYVVPVWVFMLAWMSLTFSAFLKRGTLTGLKLTLWDERIRYVVIPLLFGTALVSLITGGPLTAKLVCGEGVDLFALAGHRPVAALRHAPLGGDIPAACRNRTDARSRTPTGP